MIKKVLLLICILLLTNAYAQNNPLIVLDAKKIGFIKDINEQIQAINPDDVSIVTVYKDSLICQKYGSNSGVIIITTKKFILDTFYKNNIENSSLKEKIKSSDDLLKIGVVTDNPESKNQPYDELVKYIDTYSISEKTKKVAQIIYLNTEDSIKINPKWADGAIEIDAVIE